MPKQSWGKAFGEAAAEWLALHSDLSLLKREAAVNELSRIIRAAVRAVLPGRQQGKNLAEAMAAAEKATTRALRTYAKKRGDVV